MIMRTSSGVARSMIELIKALRQPLLPEPVVPATSRWTILTRSASTALPVTSLPSQKAMGEALRREEPVDIAQGDVVGLEVGHFDADGRLPGYRRLHAHVGRRQCVGDVVLETGHPADLDARRQLEFIARHARPGDGADDLRLHAEVAQRLDQRRETSLDRLPRLSLALPEALQRVSARAGPSCAAPHQGRRVPPLARQARRRQPRRARTAPSVVSPHRVGGSNVDQLRATTARTPRRSQARSCSPSTSRGVWVLTAGPYWAPAPMETCPRDRRRPRSPSRRDPATRVATSSADAHRASRRRRAPPARPRPHLPRECDAHWRSDEPVARSTPATKRATTSTSTPTRPIAP